MWLNPSTAQRDKSSPPTYLPDLYEENSDHFIRRDPSTIDLILAQLKKTPALCDLTDLDIDRDCLKIGAGGGFHFVSTHPITGTPALLKIGSGLGERYWMEQISRTAPDIVPTVYATAGRLGELAVGWILLERIAAYSLAELRQLRQMRDAVNAVDAMRWFAAPGLTEPADPIEVFAYAGGKRKGKTLEVFFAAQQCYKTHQPVKLPLQSKPQATQP